MFSFGEFKQEDQDKMLVALNRKVADVYGACIGQNEANISTLQMLTNIENRLEELFEQIEMMPSDKVEAAEKVSGTIYPNYSIKFRTSYQRRDISVHNRKDIHSFKLKKIIKDSLRIDLHNYYVMNIKIPCIVAE